MRIGKAQRAPRFPRQQPKDPMRAKLRARIVGFNRTQEKALAKVLLDINSTVRGRVPMKKLAAALSVAAADEAFQLLDLDPVLDAAEKDVRKILSASMEFGGERTAERIRAQLPTQKAITLGFRFDLVNPHASAFAQAHAGDLIREFGVRANRELIREVLRQGFEGGLTRFQMAKLLRDRIGLTSRMTRQVSRFRQTLEKEGRFARKQLERKVTGLAARLEARRALMIARTEVVRASAQGQIESLAQARQQGIVGAQSELEWVVLRDGKADEDCAVLDGERVKQGELFSAGVDGPPLHVQCRCMLNIHAKPPASFKSAERSEEQRQAASRPISAQADARGRLQRLRLDVLRASQRAGAPRRPTRPDERL